MASPGDSVITHEEAHRFVVDIMESSGTEHAHAELVAEMLVAADYRGHYSHGLNRLGLYPRDVKSGIICGGGKEPTIIKETVATAMVQGHNLLGPVVGTFCMNIAMKKAKETGIGMVTVGGSNHFGMAGWWTLKAAEQGLLGISCTNTPAAIMPTRSKSVTFGTNPISLAAPAQNGDMFWLDMATSAVAAGKVDIRARRGETLPHGWAVDENGQETLDPNKTSGLQPLGGLEETSGYKGYGLAMMVDILTGMLAGSTFGPNIRKWRTFDTEANLGHCFIVIDPKAFADGFEERMTDLMNHCRNLEPADVEKPVLVAGDPEKGHMRLCDKLGGIPYHPKQIEFLNELAEKYNVRPLQPLSLTVS